MKPFIAYLAFIVSFLPNQLSAQTSAPVNPVLFKMESQTVTSLNGPIPRGIYRFKSPLYITGNITKLNVNSGYVDIEAKSFLYTCSNTSDVWIRTSKITVEKYSYEGELVGTEVWDLSKESTYRQKRYYLRPFTGEFLKILTKDNLVYKTDICPVIKAKNTARTLGKR